MQEGNRMDRRGFLRGMAVAAASVVVAACGASKGTNAGGNGVAGNAPTATKSSPAGGSTPVGSATSSGTSATAAATGTVPGQGVTGITSNLPIKPIRFSGRYKESPTFAALVKAGKLPPVEQRLPDNPYVVPHPWCTEGKYGGVMNSICSDTSDWSTTHLQQESMYGHSPLRWLRDGQEVGPGLAESWESNEQTTEWTFHFRKGLKWSDGKPWTVDDILFWWEDEVGVPELNQSPPDDFVSSKGTPAKLTKLDDYTLKVAFDTPSPLFAEKTACWVNRGEGPQWMDPKHYLEQFHIKYNKKLNPKKWTDLFNSKLDWATNPDNPVMTGWKLKQYRKGQSSTWEPNPYYWCIDRWGNQLPFMEQVVWTNVQDPQVMRIQIQQGKADYVDGSWIGLTLADVSSFKATQSKSNLDLLYWDSGSGTGSALYFNLDYHDKKYRDLFRNPKFRQALSHAFNRPRVRKALYFNTGELTTGTESPKCVQFYIPGGQELYRSWRDSYVEYDPEKAKKMLDELGLKDVNGDGFREFPDGSPLKIPLDYPGGSTGNSGGDFLRRDEMLAKDWQAVGINSSPNPITPTGWYDQWSAGKLITTTDQEVGDGPDYPLYPNWWVPVAASEWAPLHGQWWYLRHSKKVKQELHLDPWKRHPPRIGPDDPEFYKPVRRLWSLLDQINAETDAVRRNHLVWEVFRFHIDQGPFIMGVVANFPQVIMANRGLRNVPRREQLPLHGYVDPWIIPEPATYDIEAYYWDDPSQHQS